MNKPYFGVDENDCDIAGLAVLNGVLDLSK